MKISEELDEVVERMDEDCPQKKGYEHQRNGRRGERLRLTGLATVPPENDTFEGEREIHDVLLYHD